MPLPQSGRRRTSLLLVVGLSVAAMFATTAGVATASDSSTTARVAAVHPSSAASHRAKHRARRTADRAATPSWSPHRQRTETSAVRARHALARAQRALSPTTVGRRPDATLALRRLWLLRGSLSPKDRKLADQLSGRPSSNEVDCSSPIACIHWTDGQVAPTWPATVRDVITYVGDTYRAAGYRATLPDDGQGGSTATDIYITNLSPGLYGYCTTDQRRLSAPGHYNVWAFCVLDNDYSEFPNHTPLENLEVTAAHEFYHATQYAYDFLEDPWLLESTAVTMEDELYTDINDNLQYLRFSPITRPQESMDDFDQQNLLYYGVWNFWRYLIEKYPEKQGPLPKLLLQIFKYADSSRGPRHNLYSVQAINKALKKLDHTTLAKEFALYSDATRRTHTVFSEGAANNYPVKKLAGLRKLGHGRKTFSVRLNHLTSATYRFDSKRLGKKAKLKLHFDLAPRSAGSEAVVTVYKSNRSTRTKLVKLNGAGNASKKYSFGSAKVQAIEVTLVNASTRMRNCYKPPGTAFSCQGTPVDQNRLERVTGVEVG